MDITQVIETHLKVLDSATGPLRRVAKVAEGTAGVFKRIEGTLTDLVPMLGGIGIGYGMKKLVENSEAYLDKIKEVRNLTGATAAETDHLFSSARKAGVSYDTMQRTMFTLSRRGSMLQQTMAVMGGRTLPTTARKFKNMGVEIEKGPVTALGQLSDAVKKGKVSTADLMMQFQIPQSAVNDFKGFLENLDSKELDRIRKQGGIGLVTDKDIDQLEKMQDAQHRINDAWNRLQVMLGKELLPVLAELTENVAAKIESWLPAAQKFGKFMSDHMDGLIASAKTFAKIMLATKAIQIGGKIPIIGPMVEKAADTFMGKLMQSVTAGLAFGKGPVAAIFGALRVGLATLAPVVAGVAAAVGLLYLGFKAFQKNVDGVRDRVEHLWDSIKARFTLIGQALSPIVDAVSALFDPGEGIITGFLGKVMALGFEKLVQVIDFLVHVFQTAVSMAVELGEQIKWLWDDVLAKGWKDYVVDPFMWSMKQLATGVGKIVDFFVDQYNLVVGFWGGKKAEHSKMGFDLGWLEAPIDMWKKHWNKTQEETDAQIERARKAAERGDKTMRDAKTPQVNFDFRGSRFDITQQFAEGFDPDRIAVAFSQDLAALGETRVQSSFAPVFAVR